MNRPYPKVFLAALATLAVVGSVTAAFFWRAKVQSANLSLEELGEVNRKNNLELTKTREDLKKLAERAHQEQTEHGDPQRAQQIPGEIERTIDGAIERAVAARDKLIEALEQENKEKQATIATLKIELEALRNENRALREKAQ